MSEPDNFEYVRKLRHARGMSIKELAKLAEYSEDSVQQWFAPAGSDRYRTVPDRAITILKLKLRNNAA